MKPAFRDASLQTLKQLRELQHERRAVEQQNLAEMYRIAAQHPGAENLHPAELGFVCSVHDWKLFYKRMMFLNTSLNGENQPAKRTHPRELRIKAA